MDKQKLYHCIDDKSPRILGLSDQIWEYAELSMLENKSAKAYVEVLKAEGFLV